MENITNNKLQENAIRFKSDPFSFDDVTLTFKSSPSPINKVTFFVCLCI